MKSQQILKLNLLFLSSKQNIFVTILIFIFLANYLFLSAAYGQSETASGISSGSDSKKSPSSIETGKWLATISIGGGEIEKEDTLKLKNTLHNIFTSERGGNYQHILDINDSDAYANITKSDILKQWEQLRDVIAKYKVTHPNDQTKVIIGILAHGCSNDYDAIKEFEREHPLSKVTNELKEMRKNETSKTGEMESKELKKYYKKYLHREEKLKGYTTNGYACTIEEYKNQESAMFTGKEIVGLVKSLNADQVILIMQSCFSGNLTSKYFPAEYKSNEDIESKAAKKNIKLSVMVPVSNLIASSRGKLENILNEIFKNSEEVDINKDGVIDYQEWKNAIIKYACQSIDYKPFELATEPDSLADIIDFLRN